MRSTGHALAFTVLSLSLAAQGGNGPAGVYGKGVPGKGGFVPRAFLQGHPGLGSSTLRLTLDQALGGTLKKTGLSDTVKKTTDTLIGPDTGIGKTVDGATKGLGNTVGGVGKGLGKLLGGK